MPPAAPWTSLATTSSAAVGRQTAGEAREAEEHDTDHEDGAPTQDVADATGGHESQAEGQGVSGHDPLQVARGGAHARLDRGRATLTMLTSSSVMKPATRQTHSAFQRRGSMPSGPRARVGCAARGWPVVWTGRRRRRWGAPCRRGPRSRSEDPGGRVVAPTLEEVLEHAGEGIGLGRVSPRHARRASSTSAA